MFAATTFSIDPAWPGASPSMGWALLAGAAFLLAALTVGTYLGTRGTSWRRVSIVLGLRLTALAVTILLMLRPSLAFEESDSVLPSRLFALIDVSKSMSLTDEFNGKSRLERARDLIETPAVKDAIRRLAEEKKIELTLFQGADAIQRFDPATPPEGRSTDVSRWLDELARESAGDVPVQAILLLSDGIDTGDPTQTVKKAAAFRGRSPVLTFGLGQSTTTGGDKDIALDQIVVEPQPILAKGKVIVKVTADAPGFEDAQTDLSLWLEDRATKTMNRVKTQTVRMAQPAGNVFVLEADAPDRDGEIKITVKATPLPGETSVTNNEISTFAYVSKEGVRVLWVEGKKRAYEGVFAIRHALAKDRRIQVVYVERANADEAAVDPYRLDQTAYDVVVIGDVSAARFGDTATLTKLRDRVQNLGMGLVMLGGYETFGNGGWAGSPLGPLFPFRGDRPGQIDERVRVEPTAEGLLYLARLSDDPERNRAIWSKSFAPLDGMSQPGTRDPRSTVFATRDGDESMPVLVGIVRGKGRVLSFAGDTTWKAWRRDAEAVAGYERFWRQMMLWLAQQENSQGAVYAQLDQRRLDRPRQLSYRVGFRGIDVTDARFTAKIVGPRGEEYPVTLGADPRGVWTPPAAGEYTFLVEGKAKTPLGQLVEGKDSARFLVFETDRELLRPAADHDLLEKIAAASDGAFARADERSLIQTFNELAARQAPAQTRVSHWPDWRRTPPSDGIVDQFTTLWRSTALLGLIVYIGCLCVEWFLRRRWGMA